VDVGFLYKSQYLWTVTLVDVLPSVSLHYEGNMLCTIVKH
jgi:hypothetical protein